MYCLCYCANGEASSCASSGCGSAIHEIAFNLSVFMLFKIYLFIYLLTKDVSIGKVQFWDRYLYFTLQSSLIFLLLLQNILNQCYLWVATLCDEFLIFSESRDDLLLWRNLLYLNESQNQFFSQMSIWITLFHFLHFGQL